MEVLLQVSERLKRYIEYIPEEVLPEVLNNLLEKSIQTVPKVETVPNLSKDDTKLDSILKALEELRANGVSIERVSNEESVSSQKEAEETIHVKMKRVQLIDDSATGLGDLLDLLK